MQVVRLRLEQEVSRLQRRYPVVCLVGARQVGKSTLARGLAAQFGPRRSFYDLEDPDDVARLSEPMAELRHRTGLIVLDEIQRRPDLFPVLRVLADERPRRRTFLVLGSAAPGLLRQGSESLAGRIAFVDVPPFRVHEIKTRQWSRLWARGGFPRSFLAANEGESFEWRRLFRQTFLERDLPMLELPNTPAASSLGRYWSMLAHVHGEVLNWSELGRSMGMSDASARRHADVLEGSLMVRQLKPWHENLSKRQVKSPKLYFRDSGLLHLLLGIKSEDELDVHPRSGASWEGFLMEQVIAAAQLQPDEYFFWRTENGAELDLLVIRGRRRVGFEFKRSSAPTLTPSMKHALTDLKLNALFVVHGGTHSFSLGPRTRAVPWKDILEVVRAAV